ncbi:MAG: Aspartate racemase [Candidatus Moranbacteria bacterium GW2011_GWF2_34_56]|nr:MAG: Aspartate racemase [Candidatus Moranbacteria bacterium GW2011_GWF1_34_10]KKP63707.1 MAG: Aspartate racemase [Candidatus Moranbacteria bacterium GW2011_GWF2_34_56]HBI16768.1 aspartate racemase [Candidatus Moranbacteria bacterium]
MKTVGLLGGTSWVSTVEYYKQINREVNKKLGKNHSAKIILNSIDYEEIKQYNYQNWEKIGDILMDEILKLDSCNVDCILICNNTLHKAYDDIKNSLYIERPIFHIVDCVGEYAQDKKFKNLLLLGTKFTMENGFYHINLEKYEMNISIPSEEERNEIQRITQEELAKEKFTDESKEWFQEIIAKYPCDAVVVGCTELPMIIKQEDYDIPILNTLELHCQKAVNFSLE